MKASSYQNKNEETLQRKTEELDSFFNIALELLCVTDTDGYFRRLNRAWETTLGYKLEELEGKRFIDFVHPDDIPGTLTAFSGLTSNQCVSSCVNRYRCKDGNYRWLEWRSSTVEKSIHTAGHDITYRKHAEEALRKSETRYRNIFEQSPIGISITTRNGQFEEANTALISMLGYEIEELKGLDVAQVYKNPEDRMAVIEAIRRNGHISNYPVSMKRKDGFVLDTLLTVSLVHDGSTELFQTSCIDVTEQKRMQKVFLETEKRYRIAIEDSNDGVAIIRDNVVTYANKKLMEIFGYDTSEDIIGKNPGVVAHPDDREMLSRNSIDRQHGKKVPPSMNLRELRRTGQRFMLKLG